MLIRTDSDGFQHPTPSEITPQAVYQDRRRWLQQAALGLGGWLLVLSWRLRGHVMAGGKIERPVTLPLYLYSMLYLALLFLAGAVDRVLLA